MPNQESFQHSGGQHSGGQRSGGCLCGAVRYLAEGAPLWSAHCHCRSCRRATGSAMATYVGYLRPQVRQTGAEPASYASSPGVVRRFCGRCGTPVSYEGERWPDQIHLFLCTFDEPESVQPEGHVYTAEQLSWLKLEDGLPRHAGTTSDDQG